jgi:salicylate hydroxylase
VTSSRTILIAGGGIAGLISALALARKGFRAVVFEQSQKLDPIGAGIQLSPNALHVLQEFGLADALRPYAVRPEDIRIRKGRSGKQIVRLPLGDYAEQRYATPYWMIHRGDLQAALVNAVRANPDIALTLGGKVEDFAVHPNGVTAHVRFGPKAEEERGVGLIAADGLWSTIRERLGFTDAPHFRRHTAWRAVVPADALPEEFRAPSINLWLARHAHLVHYPIRGGKEINIVAILRDSKAQPGWSNAGARSEIVEAFRRGWAISARDIIAAPEHWMRWSLYDRPRLRRWGNGPVTMIGDAAHPMLPFLAQGAAMAIEDAVVLADSLAKTPDDPACAMRRYEYLRGDRTARAQKAAARNGQRYHASGVEAAVRNTALRVMGGAGLLKRYDWLYAWRMATRDTR